MEIKLTLRVNNRQHEIHTDPATPLLYVLRNELLLNGPKYGCGTEQCGSCMVLIDDYAMPSCRVPVSSIADRSITTLKGLAGADGSLHPVQQAFIDEEAAQCGYCLNGMVISAVSLLRRYKMPDTDTIRNEMQRNLCRCGVQPRVIKAIQRAATYSKPGTSENIDK